MCNFLYAFQCKWTLNQTTKEKHFVHFQSVLVDLSSLWFSQCVCAAVWRLVFSAARATPLTGNDRADRTPQLWLNIRTCVFCTLQMFEALHIKAKGCTASNRISRPKGYQPVSTGEWKSLTNQITGAWGWSANSPALDGSITSLLLLYIRNWIMQTCPFQWKKARQKNESLCPFSQQKRKKNESERRIIHHYYCAGDRMTKS